MKKIILPISMMLIAFLASSFSIIAQETVTVAKVGGAEISLDKETHDYGVMQQHANGECVFIFTNNGTEDLVISNAKGSCGCTVPSWPREPIAPGASGELKVKYDTKRIGLINKSVTTEPWSSGNLILLPIEVFFLISSLSKSPVETLMRL